MKYFISANTDIGLRKNKNQDSLLIKRGIYGKKQIVLAVLCDGLGGLKRGEAASASLVKAFASWFENQLLSILTGSSFEKNLLLSWEHLISHMNRQIYGYGKAHQLQMGTTVTAMLFFEEDYHIVHVGDSRAYEIKDQIIQLTKDQTFGNHVLLQCVGASGRVKPVYLRGKIKKDAVYLLCCDGFRHEISDMEILDAFAPKKMGNELSMDQASRRMIQVNKERGEQDNISVIAIRTRRGRNLCWK